MPVSASHKAGGSPIAGEADQVGETRQHKSKDQRLVGHGTLRKIRTPNDPRHRSKESTSGNRCAEHERSRVKSPRLYFCADSSLVYPAESDSRPGPGPLDQRIAQAQSSPVCHSAVNFAPARKTRACESVEKCQARGWIALLTSSFVQPERGCHGEEGQEGEKGEEGSQEEVILGVWFYGSGANARAFIALL